ncbi:MAG TPA: sigma-70 family RNA polymerase sigma factor [Candidatus Paceibacterota bacterium]|nr:sigma-70 family RNA polymerase sigma factor [Verrucomicrobiota bacterium]HRY51531.1 sigma-70 family RNA polymerase sigma factor [Candidatus Paceibacterota bacterium]HSA00885.1 sigma-70 family RNA polymerase sigma factor [Candidatus Paceibacterota bacterium]
MSEVTRILDRVSQGEAQAAEELLPLVYEELRKLATIKMAQQPPGQTLQPTALVHEAWLRLAGSQQREWQNSRHFFAAAAEAMRQILIDAARKKRRFKRGGGWQRLNLDEIHLAIEADPDGLLAIDEALEDFTREDPAKAELVKLRFFAGLTLPQAAQMLGLSLGMAKRSWAFARAWLYRHLTQEG